MVRIRSEHAIGYLKGRFQSLKELQVAIIDEREYQFATAWIAACIAVHNFALHCEAEEREEAGEGEEEMDADPFLVVGLDDKASNIEFEETTPATRGDRLARGKAFHERLKALLLRAKRYHNNDA